MVRSFDPRMISGVVALTGMVGALNGTLVIPLIPVFPAILGITGEQAGWLVTVTLVSGAVIIPAVSRLADMYGRRRLVIVCLSVMGGGAVLSAASADIRLMLIGRALAGLGVPLIPIGIAVLRDTVPRDRVGTAVALMSATTGIGAAIGLPLAGILFETLGWRWIFIVTAIASLGLTALVIAVVPAVRAGAGGRFDFPGALLLAVATGSVTLTVAMGDSWGWTSRNSLVLLSAGAIAFVSWVFVELRVGHPLVDLRVSSRRPVFLTNAVALLVGVALLINLLLAMQQLQAPVDTGYGLGLSVLEATLVLLPGSLLMVAMAPVNGSLLNVLGGRPVLLMGLLLMAAGYICRVFLHADVSQVLIAAAVVSLGSGLAYAAMPVIIMQSVPDAITAAANGLNALLRQLGTAASSAIVAGVIAADVLIIDDVGYPAWSAIAGLDLLAVSVCLTGSALAALIPRFGEISS